VQPYEAHAGASRDEIDQQFAQSSVTFFVDWWHRWARRMWASRPCCELCVITRRPRSARRRAR
jgi:hypothetical protein